MTNMTAWLESLVGARGSVASNPHDLRVALRNQGLVA